MEVSTLNLARKWRSQTFDTLIGQDIVVKILKNSLYTSYYFPVYLFAGQRGCGKTSTARIFAAALNCLNLKEFQEKPKTVILPCGTCHSCCAMRELRHPDFIEIDAASHTGVDNMRSIIDAAYYLPVLGHKKIYLIDEAHMLSKAAFNALLKVLEEPPMHAHFILATTDPEKIIETVRSRCFTLFFDAIDYTVLADHLERICQQEHIQYSYDALVYIARCAEGSARDALNMLEMVRFSHPRIDKELVLTVLGHIDDQRLADFLKYIAFGQVHSFLTMWNNATLQRISAANIWAGFVRIARAMVWYHYGIQPADLALSTVNALKSIDQSFFQNFLQELYNVEPLFIRTSDPRGILDLVLLQLCSRYKSNAGESSNNQSGLTHSIPLITDNTAIDGQEDELEEDSEHNAEPCSIINTGDAISRFKERLSSLRDPMLASILSQVILINHDVQAQTLYIQLSSSHTFFADKLYETASLWHPFIQDVYKTQDVIKLVFDGHSVSVPAYQKKTVILGDVVPAVEPKKAVGYQMQSDTKRFMQGSSYRQPIIQEKKIDISDIQRWPCVNRVLGYFPGAVTVVDEARL